MLVDQYNVLLTAIDALFNDTVFIPAAAYCAVQVLLPVTK